MAIQTHTHRPAIAWLTDLQKAKEQGNAGVLPKVSVQDLLERINATNLDSSADPNADYGSLIPTSPRSVEACFRNGVDPIELQFKPFAYYRRPTDASEDVSRLRFEKHEAVRQERVRSLIDTRKHLIDEGWTAEGVPRPAPEASGRQNKSEMLERERARLDVLRRRQEKDLQQMVQLEVARKELQEKQQKKVVEMERRASEMAKLKQENELLWITRQREIELQKAQEERELEREAKRLAEEQFKREKEIQYREEEEEKRRKREAFLSDLERRRKAEQSRAETQAILAAQVEEVRMRKLEMERREVERTKRAEQESKAAALANAERRKKAEARIRSAQDQNERLRQQRRSELLRREQQAEDRRKELESAHKREEEMKRQEEQRKERERQAVLHAAIENEETRKASLRAKADEKERQLAELYTVRERDHQLRKVQREFELQLKLDNVDSIQKQQLYQRQQLLGKIMSEYERARSIMAERQSLQDQRRMANISASMHRQSLMRAMENLRNSKSIDKLAGADLSTLLPKSRPSTAF